ncbi:SixA phosphatase family protein [Sediminibacterium sp. TEGAF015]|uniref:SixA phosphatase family protein n=1 Tax=Sediminibacterium sp. TEGAF015 TaxID=575378 RepID=UPI00222FFBB3|nr:phosphoglycerate mutase family protein [Sediminibacterium sp. TEGAF015]
MQMKLEPRSILLKLFFAAGLVVFGWITTVAQSTTVWIVRHAEKDTAFANRANPDLTPVGKQRAMDLATYLQKENIVQVLSTDTKRTVQTAAHIKAPIELYNPRSIQMVVEKINTTWKGKTILLVGHSNTVLETIDALGGNRPVALLNDEDYDYIFKVVIDDAGKATATAYQYGQPHRGGNATMR